MSFETRVFSFCSCHRGHDPPQLLMTRCESQSLPNGNIQQRLFVAQHTVAGSHRCQLHEIYLEQLVQELRRLRVTKTNGIGNALKLWSTTKFDRNATTCLKLTSSLFFLWIDASPRGSSPQHRCSLPGCLGTNAQMRCGRCRKVSYCSKVRSNRRV